LYERLGEATLKSGERMEVGVILAPDPDWRDRIVPFLGHKGEPYASHIRRSNEGPLDALETRFYIGHLDGQVISEVMIVGGRGAGILGHVYTLPEQRRKGAYQAVMAAQMADMPRRGFQVLALGTGFESAPYWIYHSFGFRGIGPGRGEMTWVADEAAAARLFQPGRLTTRDARWDDWGHFGWLSTLPQAAEEELPRGRVMGLLGLGLVEGPFVRLLLAREQTPGMTVRVLESEHGATVAWAILAPATLGTAPVGARLGSAGSWLPEAWILDLHAHPALAGALPELLADLPWPEAPVAATITEPAGPKAAALSAGGFTHAASLPRWLKVGDAPRRAAGLWVRL
jgi:hypothetical protein